MTLATTRGLLVIFLLCGGRDPAPASSTGRSQSDGDQQFLIVSNRIANASISIGERATEVERFAAEEMQRYIKAISGAELPILVQGAEDQLPCVILIGTPDSNKAVSELQAEGQIEPLSEQSLGSDGFVVKTVRRGRKTLLLLGGNRSRGVLFAIYSFLEDSLGVRFFGFGKAGETIPAMPTINVVPGDKLQRPQFRFRIADDNNFSSTNREMLTKVADWAVKNKFNAFLLSLDDLNHVATKELTKRGMEIWAGGHVWAQFTPGKSLYALHPEYFPLIDGKRTFPGDKRAISFCYSNPDAMKMFVAKAVAYVRERPMLNVFACWPEDGPQHWAQCQCEGCKKHTFSEWNLITMNSIAQAFEADPALRKVRVQWIAYNEASVPPFKISPYNNGRNIDLLYANGARDFLAPMDSPSNRKCAKWLANDTLRKHVNTDFKENATDDDFAAYSRLASMLNYLKEAKYQGNICLLEYVNGHVGHWLDLPYMQHVQTGPWMDAVFPRDMRFYVSQGISGWADCYDWPNDVPDPFWNRLMAQVLWNPSVNVQGVKKDFYAKFYGAAGSIMQTYFKKVWTMLDRDKPEREDDATLKSLHLLLLEAQKIAAPDSEYGRRVDKVIRWHDSLRLAKSSANFIIPPTRPASRAP